MKRLHDKVNIIPIIAKADNNFGISGIAPNCKFIPIQISDETGVITTSSLLDGIFYALKNGADVINISIAMSLADIRGISPNKQKQISKEYLLEEARMWEEVYTIAADQGVIIVQAAGNDGLLAEIDPMKRSHATIIVGALSRNEHLADFSNVGNMVSVFAPGVGILSSMPNDQMGKLDGTSMASPIVAGCVALIKSTNNTLTNDEIIRLIQSTGKKIPNHQGVLIQIGRILNELS